MKVFVETKKITAAAAPMVFSPSIRTRDNHARISIGEQKIVNIMYPEKPNYNCQLNLFILSTLKNNIKFNPRI
jgi:hypothetical protein